MLPEVAWRWVRWAGAWKIPSGHVLLFSGCCLGGGLWGVSQTGLTWVQSHLSPRVRLCQQRRYSDWQAFLQRYYDSWLIEYGYLSYKLFYGLNNAHSYVTFKQYISNSTQRFSQTRDKQVICSYAKCYSNFTCVQFQTWTSVRCSVVCAPTERAGTPSAASSVGATTDSPSPPMRGTAQVWEMGGDFSSMKRLRHL